MFRSITYVRFYVLVLGEVRINHGNWSWMTTHVRTVDVSFALLPCQTKANRDSPLKCGASTSQRRPGSQLGEEKPGYATVPHPAY